VRDRRLQGWNTDPSGPGRSLKSPDGRLSGEFRPSSKVKYEADEGLILWIGTEDEE